MTLLSVSRLCKRYPGFLLDGVSLSVNYGEIVGFIGRNGAGKSTTLKSLLGLVHPDSGDIGFFGGVSEDEAKQRVGFIPGGVDYYKKTKLRLITDVTQRFYNNWDTAVYRQYLNEFSLDENKTPSELSEGMKVKYSLALALSHGAELLILDEPTSGLDPISRDELLNIFLRLRSRGVGILFSTHIITDLERTADRIVYIRNGRIFADSSIEEFEGEWRIVEFEAPPGDLSKLIGVRQERWGISALVRTADALHYETRPASLEEIMMHIEMEDHK